MARKSAAKRSVRRARVDTAQLSARILDAFSAKAKRYGLRALLMTELASELRISATTLYKAYPSKEALAMACVERWANELGAAEAAENGPRGMRDGFERYMHWIEAWADANAAIAPAFMRDLRSDYPAVWKAYRAVINERKRRGATLLRPHLKAEVDERVAFSVLNTIFSTVLEPEFATRLGVSRREAIRHAVAIWAGGALVRKGQVRSLRSASASVGAKRAARR